MLRSITIRDKYFRIKGFLCCVVEKVVRIMYNLETAFILHCRVEMCAAHLYMFGVLLAERH